MGRYIQLDGTFNFRDLGGVTAAEGRTVKEGLLFRADALHKLTEADHQWFLATGIRTVVDFRSQAEAVSQPDRLPAGLALVTLAPHAAVAAQASAAKGEAGDRVAQLVAKAETEEGRAYLQKNLDSMEGQMRKFAAEETGIRAFGDFMRLVASGDAAPLVFHCKGGKDRTGWGAALIYLALGVPREVIMQDYLDTAKYNQARNAKRLEEYRQLTDNQIVLDFMASLMQVKERYLTAALEEVDRAGGPQAYLSDVLGLTAQELYQMKTLYLA